MYKTINEGIELANGLKRELFKVDKESSPQHFWTDYSNRGTSYTGRNRFGLGYANNNLLGIEDSLTVRGIFGDKNNVYTANVDYNLPVSRYDTRLGAYFAHSHADIVEALRGCDVLLCQGMGWRAAEELQRSGIEPIVFSGEMTPEEAVAGYLSGSLKATGTFCRCHE